MLAAVPLLAVGVVDGAAVLGRHSAGHARPVSSPAPRAGRQAAADRSAVVAAQARAAAIRGVLARRSDAVMTHDRAEWREVLDPQHPTFVRHQMRVFDNLQQVPFGSWAYDFNAKK